MHLYHRAAVGIQGFDGFLGGAVINVYLTDKFGFGKVSEVFSLEYSHSVNPFSLSRLLF